MQTVRLIAVNGQSDNVRGGDYSVGGNGAGFNGKDMYCVGASPPSLHHNHDT